MSAVYSWHRKQDEPKEIIPKDTRKPKNITRPRLTRLYDIIVGFTIYEIEIVLGFSEKRKVKNLFEGKRV